RAASYGSSLPKPIKRDVKSYKDEVAGEPATGLNPSQEELMLAGRLLPEMTLCQGNIGTFRLGHRSSYFAFLRTNYQASATAFLRAPSLIFVALLVVFVDSHRIPNSVLFMCGFLYRDPAGMAAQKPYSSTGAGLVLRGSNSKWYQGDVVVPSVFFMEGSIIQDILERRIDKCDKEMEIPEKSTNKSNMAMNDAGRPSLLALGLFRCGLGTAYIRNHTYKPMDTGTYSISIGLLKSDLFHGTKAERRVTIFTSSFRLINQTPNQTPIDWEMSKVLVQMPNPLDDSPSPEIPNSDRTVPYQWKPSMKKEGAFPAAYFAKRWQERNDLAQTYLNNLKAWPGLKEEESQPCRKADRRVGWSGMRSYGKEYITASLIREFLMIAVFRMLDPLLFYVLPESVLIPMLCGAEHLIFAGIKLFLCRGLVQ
ncbi:putative NADH:ubiquinone reductase, partial [Tanacetum coccineum]